MIIFSRMVRRLQGRSSVLGGLFRWFLDHKSPYCSDRRSSQGADLTKQRIVLGCATQEFCNFKNFLSAPELREALGVSRALENLRSQNL